MRNMNNFKRLYINLRLKVLLIINFVNQKKYPFYFFVLTLFLIIYILFVRQVKSFTELKKNNFNSFLKSNEFINIKEYIFENLNSPYREYNYVVKNNDTIEKILKKYNIASIDINNLASKIKKKNYLIYMLEQRYKS